MILKIFLSINEVGSSIEKLACFKILSHFNHKAKIPPFSLQTKTKTGQHEGIRSTMHLSPYIAKFQPRQELWFQREAREGSFSGEII